jgi:hypothetical protein
MSSYSRAGAFWSRKEDDDLMNYYIKYDYSLNQLADLHRRSVGAIRSRIKYNGLIMMVENHVSMEYISHYIRIPIMELNYFYKYNFSYNKNHYAETKHISVLLEIKNIIQSLGLI